MVVVAVLAALAVVVVGGAALLPLLDRYAHGLAERKAADALTEAFGRPPTVRLLTRPFLPQARRGVYGHVNLSGGGLRIGPMTGATLDADLRNVHLPWRDLRRRQVTEVPCEHVEGRIVLPYGELARTANVPGLELTLRNGRLYAAAALPVPGLNQIARVSGQALLALDGGRTVWMRVRNVSVAGFSLPGVVLNQLLPALNVPIPLPELPYGLRIDELLPTADGLAVCGSADAVVFRKLG